MQHTSKIGAGPSPQKAGIARLFAAEMNEHMPCNLIQIHGGDGDSCECEVDCTHSLRCALMSIGEGTGEIQRLIIARSILGN